MSYLLVADLDGTILGNDEATARFVDWHRSFHGLIDVAYASGRFCTSIREDVIHYGLPDPVALIGGVGTEIQLKGADQVSAEWASELSHHWNVDDIRERLSAWPGLSIQPEEFQSSFKVSYFLDDATELQIDDIRKRLESPWLRTELVYSSRRDLDILPQGASKGAATAFVGNTGNYPTDCVVVSGDSGNDMSMFLHGFRGVIVANAQEELRRLSSSNIFHSKLAFADGVIDGVEYWLRFLDEPSPGSRDCIHALVQGST